MERNTDGVMRLCKFSKRTKQIKFTVLYKGFKHSHYSVVVPQSKSSDNNNNQKKKKTNSRVPVSTNQLPTSKYAICIRNYTGRGFKIVSININSRHQQQAIRIHTSPAPQPNVLRLSNLPRIFISGHPHRRGNGTM